MVGWYYESFVVTGRVPGRLASPAAATSSVTTDEQLQLRHHPRSARQKSYHSSDYSIMLFTLKRQVRLVQQCHVNHNLCLNPRLLPQNDSVIVINVCHQHPSITTVIIRCEVTVVQGCYEGIIILRWHWCYSPMAMGTPGPVRVCSYSLLLTHYT